ncbi:hypothetical protein [Rhodococcus aetherivorans]
MRPTPAETAAAVGRLLDDWAADETQSTHMRWMLRRVSAVLAQTDWEDASSALAASNARLLSTVEAGLKWIDSLDRTVAEQYVSAQTAMREVLAAGSDGRDYRTSLQARNSLNQALRGAIDAFLSALESDDALDGHASRPRLGVAYVLESLDDL